MISAGGSCSILFCWPWWPLWLVLIEAGSHWPTIWQAALAGSQSPTIWQAALVAKKWKRIWVHPVSEVWICWRPLFFEKSWKKMFCDVCGLLCLCSGQDSDKASGSFCLVSCCLVHVWQVFFCLDSDWFLIHVVWWVFARFCIDSHWFLRFLNDHLIESEVLIGMILQSSHLLNGFYGFVLHFDING